jgi:carbonic anhydrase
MRTHYWETRQSMTPHKALQFLKEGNQRFINNLRINHNYLELIDQTAERQFPFAAILSCSDSRVPVELVFDQGLGDVFSIRLAGNIASTNAIGSMEYSCKILGSKVIIVLGHTGCGAVKGVCDHLKMGNLGELLSYIHPAMEAETSTIENRTSSNKGFINNVSRLNVQHQIEAILAQSQIIKELVNTGDLDIIGAQYDVETGKVNFLDKKESIKNQYEKFEIY